MATTRKRKYCLFYANLKSRKEQTLIKQFTTTHRNIV